jgi:hypothetical protein
VTRRPVPRLLLIIPFLYQTMSHNPSFARGAAVVALLLVIITPGRLGYKPSPELQPVSSAHTWVETTPPSGGSSCSALIFYTDWTKAVM